MALDNHNLIFNLDQTVNTFNLLAKQFDTTGARSFTFQFVKSGTPFSLNDINVSIGGVKPDGKNIFNAVKIVDAENGIVELDLTSQMLVVNGVLKLEFIFMEGNTRLSSYPFQINVIPGVTNFNAIESSDEFSALTNALNSANEAIKNTQPQTLAKNIMDNALSSINATFSDCNSFTMPNKYFKWDTGNGEFINTPLGILAKGSGIVFELINFGSEGRIQQEFRQIYPPDQTKIWVRNFGVAPDTWSNWSVVYTDAYVSEDAEANKVVQRNSEGDVVARMVRTNYGDENSMVGAIAYRVNNTSDNYTRFCSNPEAVRGWLETVCINDFSNRLGLNGYQHLPNGLILQWGYFSNLSSKNLNMVNLPIALQDNGYVPIAIMANGANTNPAIKIVDIKKQGFNIQAYADGLDACWFVVGSL